MTIVHWRSSWEGYVKTVRSENKQGSACSTCMRARRKRANCSANCFANCWTRNTVVTESSRIATSHKRQRSPAHLRQQKHHTIAYVARLIHLRKHLVIVDDDLAMQHPSTAYVLHANSTLESDNKNYCNVKRHQRPLSNDVGQGQSNQGRNLEFKEAQWMGVLCGPALQWLCSFFIYTAVH